MSDQATGKQTRRLYSLGDLRDIGISVSRVTLWRWARDGRFPAPIRLGGSNPGNLNFWLKEEVDAWLEERIRARDVPSSSVFRLVDKK